MAARDRRVDAYIAKSADFARPILAHLRAGVHDACPEVEETIKWGFPHFMYKGMLCAMAAFKQHCTFGFWKGSLLKVHGLSGVDGAMGQFGRITGIGGLPGKAALRRLVRAAMALNEDGVTVKRPVTARRKRAALPVPADLKAALARNRRARVTFEAFSPSHRREYVEWITEAKRPETRAKRLATTLDWLGEGKTFGWKYAKC